jgi:hypothetical protein
MTFAPALTAKVKQLAFEFVLPASKISFLKSELAYEAAKSGAEIKAAPEGGEKIGVLIGIANGRDGILPEGQIAYFTFKISHDIEAGDIAIGVRNIAMRDPAGVQVDAVRETEIPINIVSSKLFPMISCFFYMH